MCGRSALDQRSRDQQGEKKRTMDVSRCDPAVCQSSKSPQVGGKGRGPGTAGLNGQYLKKREKKLYGNQKKSSQNPKGGRQGGTSMRLYLQGICKVGIIGLDSRPARQIMLDISRSAAMEHLD